MGSLLNTVLITGLILNRRFEYSGPGAMLCPCNALTLASNDRVLTHTRSPHRTIEHTVILPISAFDAHGFNRPK